MDNVVQSRKTEWNNAQAYGFAAICLTVGIASGYLLHGPAKPAMVPAAIEQSAPAPAASLAMPSPEHLKQMGDKMAEPLLKDLKSNENDANTLAKLASVYFRSGQYPKAIEYYEKSLKAKPSAEGYVSLSNTYHYAGQDEKAIAMLNRALEVDPKSSNALFNLGMLNWKVKKDPQAAIQNWQLLLKNKPNHPKRAQVEGLIAKVKQSE
jgi:tetratricopeptide (TPR) repeat protein